ncbi:oligosaccharide flippase family protein [Vibrio navarrensis]|uniref:Oligosaccharide flippase family protein n=1 Tax=Vibrio navarrensis TaxID=29495 RepID=A0AAJ4IBG1_9VIBR|nr:oligosaccharide flippase family protein [Vibrio navarrensis]
MKTSNFYKSVAVLLSGTAAAQAITLSILPILTRIYSPEELGMLAIFTATTSILLTVSCLRMEMAIPIQKFEVEARSVLVLCIQLVTFNVIICLIFCFAIYFIFPELLGGLGKLVFLIPVGILLGGVYLAINNYAVREKEFSLISKSRLRQSISCAFIQIFGGLFGFGAIMLLLGYIFNLGAGAFYLKKRLLEDLDFKSFVKFEKSKEIFYQNIRFPKYSVVESFANTAGIQIPVLIIASSIGVAETAFLFLAMRIIQAPMALLGNSISQVFYSQASENYKEGTLSSLTLKVSESTFKIGVGPIIFIAVVAQNIVGKALGQDWEVVGVYITTMSPWFLFQFLASPISPVMYVTGKQNLFMRLTIFGFSLKIFCITVAAIKGLYVIESFVFANTLFYMVCFYIFSQVGGNSMGNIIKSFMKVVYIPFAWLFGALFINHILAVF